MQRKKQLQMISSINNIRSNPINPNFLHTPQTDSGTDFRDVLATNRQSSILVAINSGSERDKLIDAIHQARIFTPSTFTPQPTTNPQREPELSISVVGNVRPDWDDTTDLQKAHIFLVPFTSKATLCLSKIFEFSLNGDEDGVVTKTCHQTSVQWQFQLYGEDREFIEGLSARIRKIMQSQESMNNALERYNNGDNLTKDEILDGIIAQYAKEPITMTSFRAMLFDLYSHGALTYDETWLFSWWGGLGIEVVAEEYEYQLWLKGIEEEYDGPTFETPDLLEQFLTNWFEHHAKLLEERRNARAEAANKQDVDDEQNRKLREVSGVYESTSDSYHNSVVSTSTYLQ